MGHIGNVLYLFRNEGIVSALSYDWHQTKLRHSKNSIDGRNINTLKNIIDYINQSNRPYAYKVAAIEFACDMTRNGSFYFSNNSGLQDIIDATLSGRLLKTDSQKTIAGSYYDEKKEDFVSFTDNEANSSNPRSPLLLSGLPSNDNRGIILNSDYVKKYMESNPHWKRAIELAVSATQYPDGIVRAEALRSLKKEMPNFKIVYDVKKIPYLYQQPLSQPEILIPIPKITINETKIDFSTPDNNSKL